MIDINTLEKEEVEYIIHHIKPDEFRKYFQKNPRKFSTIKRGFRPEKLANDTIITTIKDNLDKRAICSFIEAVIEKWLKEIELNIFRLNENGYNEGEALIKTIPHSIFDDFPQLYFKLTNQNITEEYVNLLQDAISLTKKISSEKESEEEKNKKIIENNAALLDEKNKEINSLQYKMDQRKEKIILLRNECDKYKNSYSSVNAEVIELRAKYEKEKSIITTLSSKLKYYKDLENYIDDEFDSSMYHKYPHMSIGQIYHDPDGQTRINRWADIKDGEISIFEPDNNEPLTFDNRDRLYYGDKQAEDGKIGIWNWVAEKNTKYPNRDYIKSEYNNDANFIEVINCKNCNSLSDLKHYLKNGIDVELKGEKFLFIFGDDDEREGLLCSASKLGNINGKIKLLDDVYILPAYKIRVSDIISLPGIKLFRKMKMGIPKFAYYVRSPYDAIKNIILFRATNTALREQKWSIKEARKYREYLQSIPNKTIAEELKSKYGCSEEDANLYVEQFCRNIDDYLTASDFDTEVLSLALNRNPALIERCKNQLAKEWNVENSSKVAPLKKELDSIKITITEKQEEVNELIKQKSKVTDEINKIQSEIDAKNQLASDVENSIASRIEEAKNNAAEFISKMAFVSPVSQNVVDSNANKNKISIYESKIAMRNEGSIDDMEEFLEELADNISMIGYDDEISVEMSSMITFSICHQMPIVVGENSLIIGQCLAATINGESLSEIFLSNQGTDIDDLFDSLERITSSGITKRVILIHGVFDGYSINIYNALVNCLKAKRYNCIIILSSEGIPENMLPPGILAHSFYIDGGVGLDNACADQVGSYDISVPFELRDQKLFTRKRKELVDFKSVISNTQLNLYALYLSNYARELNESHEILKQMIMTAKAVDKEEALESAFNENDIQYGIKLLKESF